MTYVPEDEMARGDGPLVAEFQQTFCRTTKDGYYGNAGQLIKFRPWQFTLTSALFARRPDGRRRHRRALIGFPRKNGKSALGSGIGLYGLLSSGQGAEIYSCAKDRDQAKIVFGVAKTMVKMEPQLDFEQGGLIKCYRDVLEVPSTGSIYKALSSDAFSQEGLNANLVIYDELHAAPNDELYQVMSNAFGARRDPMLISITTAGVKSDTSGGDSICYRLYQYGQRVASGEVEDPSFFFAWWGASDNDDPGDPETRAKANPAYDDLIDPEDLESAWTYALENGTVNDFKTKRLNMWVSQARAWLPEGAWVACQRRFEFAAPEKGIVLGFDGSKNGDCTALVGVTVEEEPKIKVFNLWERPLDKEEAMHWHVPRAEVMDAIREVCRTYEVREVAADEFIWVSELEELQEEGIPVVSFPQNLSRMGPATQRFYEMVNSKRLWQDGDPRLARHVGNAQLKTDTRGSRLAKDHRASPRKIDLAVAAVMAIDRAGYWLTQDGPGMWNGHKVSDLRFVWLGNSCPHLIFQLSATCLSCGDPLRFTAGALPGTRSGMHGIPDAGLPAPQDTAATC